jgi:transcription elongation factor GreB
MRKGFTRKPQADEPATPVKNYITPSGLQRLKDEHRFLLTRERPAVTEVVARAASNGDRSENAGNMGTDGTFTNFLRRGQPC